MPNGILANQTGGPVMTDGDADGVVAGYATNARITLSTTPAGAGHSWALSKPSGATVRSDLSASSGASVSFVPDVEGVWLAVCTVSGPITYTLQIQVAAAAPSTISGALRFLARALASITTPLAGTEALYYDKDVGRYRSKTSAGTAREIDPGGRCGAFALTDGTVTIADTTITANSVVVLMVTDQTNPGKLRVTLDAGVGFTITSDDGTDASSGRYSIIN